MSEMCYVWPKCVTYVRNVLCLAKMRDICPKCVMSGQNARYMSEMFYNTTEMLACHQVELKSIQYYEAKIE